MESKDDRSIFFLTLSLICIWLILDSMYGKKYIDNFLKTLFPFYRTTEERKELVIGQNLIDAIKNIFSSIFGGLFSAFGKSNNTDTEDTESTDKSETAYKIFGGMKLPTPGSIEYGKTGVKK